MYSIRVKDVSKIYELYDKPIDRLKESLSITKKVYHKNFYALNNISFDVKKGETVGIIGTNGSGKSTILKIITGVLSQTSGSLEVDGRISALLELGAGFHPDYTGMENIRMNGSLMGLSTEEIEERLPKIIDFADIGDFINQPVKTYSSGMFVRLAFATQIFSNPDILIVDEALSVGDIRFQQKCYRAMDVMMKDKTVILVTHDTAAVTRFCKRVIWLERGKVRFDGEVAEGLKQYQEYLINQSIEDDEKSGKDDFAFIDVEQKLKKANESMRVPELDASVRLMGNKKAQIYGCGIFNEKDELIENIEPGTMVKFIANIEFYEKVAHPILGLAIKDRLGNDVIGINTQTLNIDLPVAEGRKQYIMSFKMPELNRGQYTITVAIASGYQQEHVQLCWADDAIVFRVLDRQYDIPGTIYLSQGEVEVLEIGEK